MSLQRWAEQYVNPYFCVRIEPGMRAGDAFEDAKAGAIRSLERQIEAIRCLPFSAFREHVLSPSWHEDLIYPAEQTSVEKQS